MKRSIGDFIPDPPGGGILNLLRKFKTFGSELGSFATKFKVRNDCILNIKIMTRQNSLIGKAYDSYL